MSQVKISVGSYHQDGGRPTPEMQHDHAIGGERVGEGSTPMLSLKCAFFLTDTTEPECGALKVVPGSHVSDIPPGPGASESGCCVVLIAGSFLTRH